MASSTAPRTVVGEPLSVAAFSPFGFVVSAGLKAGSSANQGTALRFDRCAELVTTRPQASPNLAVFRSTQKTLPFSVTLLEQHPCSTQTFLPMVCTRFLIVERIKPSPHTASRALRTQVAPIRANPIARWSAMLDRDDLHRLAVGKTRVERHHRAINPRAAAAVT